MNQCEAVKYINTYLSRNDYSNLFKPNPNTLLQENRRVSRHSNVIKYGRIPFKMKGRHVDYNLSDIQELCNDKLRPICTELEKMRMARAEKALLGARLPYAD
jgi:hypothetical protein